MRAAVDAVESFPLVSRALPSLNLREFDALFVVSAGKAAWPMARAISEAFSDRIAAGVVAGPRASGAVADALRWFDAGHPLPNSESARAGDEALRVAELARARNVPLVVLLSGGASAMLALPVSGVTIADKAATARALMNAGCDIAALNTVRKHLSRVKGGRLAAAAGRTITLAISDVHSPIADDPAVIGSGPTVCDPTTYRDALAVLRYTADAPIPASVRQHIENGVRGGAPETPKSGDLKARDHVFRLIATRMDAVWGARVQAESLGYVVEVLAPPTSGDAREAGRRFAEEAIAIGRRRKNRSCVIAAGETTVRVAGAAVGGRNQEFALAAARTLAPHPIRRPNANGSRGNQGL
jgi:glycerate 2-kinase